MSKPDYDRAAMRLTLGDVLDHRELGLELSCGGDAARSAPVDGAHSIDLPDPVPWLQEGWLMLTTGRQLRGSASAQRRLVAELAQARIAGLAFGVGVAMAHVPRALLQEAERLAFPVLTVPLETPFREIESFVNRAYLSEDLYVLRRLNSMQRYLLDAMHQGAPEQALVERLASLLGGAEVAYVDGAAAPIATTGPHVDWAETALAAGRANVREFEYGGQWGVVMPVMEGDTPTAWLVALFASLSVSGQVARSVVRTASELLGLVSVARLAGARERRSRRRRLGLRVVGHVHGRHDAGLAAGLAAEGIDFTQPCRVAVLAAGAAGPADLEDRLERAVEAVTAEMTLAADGDRFLVLAQDDLAGLGARLGADRRLTHLRGGVSEPVAGVGELAGAAGQARLALAVALGTPGGEPVVRHEELEPGVALLGAPLSAALRARLTGVLAPLDGEPRLRAALVAYLDADLDIGQAALALGLHRNSIRYRLDRAEALLGRPLRDPGTIASVHLALVAERIAATERDGPPAAGAPVDSARGRS
jgi:PucR family transcriptional regulator, purine catabolism regulatory protein